MDHLDDDTNTETDTDTDIDADLRELFASDRLAVPVRADAEQIIVTGARWVRRRRVMAATASGALGVAAAVAAGFVLAGGTPGAVPLATSTAARPPASSSVAVTSLPAPSTAQARAVDGTTTTTPPPKPTTEKTDLSKPAPPKLNYTVLGPTGLREVRLGQTLDEAKATGMLGDVTSHTAGGCDEYQLVSDDRVAGFVYVSATVREISAAPAQTPQGVGPGWTIEQVRTVYPDIDEQQVTGKGEATVPVPGNAAAVFRLGVPSGTVTSVSLAYTDSTCW
ncbi:hypothetical protein [Actinophytocola sp.]|uniref:hypothetical protein n=1 Tax=Actinophytocola sp. TaxID=1872138 RepID=UPI002D5757DC|nr:hypothetical protein [Actinophytocola sp.]HYQ63009.1 hypothetical protein [Actinophytocola sp.]